MSTAKTRAVRSSVAKAAGVLVIFFSSTRAVMIGTPSWSWVQLANALIVALVPVSDAQAPVERP